MHFAIHYGNEILTNGVRTIILKNLDKEYNKLFLALLNSNILDWYIKTHSLTYNIKPYELEELPIIPIDDKIIIQLSKLTDYILYLVFIERLNLCDNDLSKFGIDLINLIIYELYFKEKFHEDGPYPEPKEYLLEAVSKHLKPIDYDKYAELYWKQQLENNLTPEEEQELKQLEEQNLKTIKEVYELIKNDNEANDLINKIKSHEWVKIIENS